MFASNSLVDECPLTVKNPYPGLTILTGACLITHFAWLFVEQLRDLGKGSSVLVWMVGQSPYWFSGLHSATMLVCAHNLVNEDYFSFRQAAYTTQQMRKTYFHARERRFCYHVLWITAMAALSVTPDVVRLWWSLVGFFSAIIEPPQQGQWMDLEAMSGLSIKVSLTSFAFLGMTIVWIPFAGALNYENEACTAKADGNFIQEKELPGWGNLKSMETLEWDPLERMLVDNSISDKVKIALLRSKAAQQKTMLAAKDEEARRHKAEVEAWKDMSERAQKDNQQGRDRLRAASLNHHKILAQLL